MSEVMLETPRLDADHLQRRIHELGREAIEGRRPLSDLLGETFRELRAAVAGVREMEAELRRREEAIAALRANGDGGGSHPAVLPGSDGLLLSQNGNGNGDGAALFLDAADSLAGEEEPGFPVELFPDRAPAGAAALESSLRARIGGALYLGLLDGGDRLPSIRELAHRTGLNHKAVRRVYRALEQSGLIEVRDRSGIYLAEPGAPPPAGAGETERWVAGVAVEAVERGLRLADLPTVVQRSVAARRLRCACVESTADDRFALCREIGERFGVETVPVPVAPGSPFPSLPEVDLVVTTPFHAHEVRRALPAGRPMVVATLHPGVRRAVAAVAGDALVWVVCEDPAYGERLRRSFDPATAERIRVTTADRVEEAGAEGPLAGVATLAARARLGEGDLPAAVAVPPYLSPRVSRELATLIVRLNTARAG